jgi:hypothetical protein
MQTSLQRSYNWHGCFVGWTAYGDPTTAEDGNSGCHVAMLCSWFWRGDGCQEVILDIQIRLCGIGCKHLYAFWVVMWSVQKSPIHSLISFCYVQYARIWGESGDVCDKPCYSEVLDCQPSSISTFLTLIRYHPLGNAEPVPCCGFFII